MSVKVASVSVVKNFRQIILLDQDIRRSREDGLRKDAGTVNLKRNNY